MKNLFIGLMILFAALGLILYFNMFHFACVLSFLCALIAGVFLTNYLTDNYKKTIDRQEALRRRLTADVAHELRTPLTSIGTHLEAMISGLFDPTPERLQSCHDEVVRLGKLVSDLDMLAKSESDRTLNKSEVNLLALAENVALAWQAQAGSKEIALTVSGEAVTLRADYDRITQALTNLVSNAIKYTPPQGRVTLTVSERGRFGILTITDSGIGITAEDLPYIFERFYRADKSRSRVSGGSGIGLAIAQSIARLHGGRIEAESQPEKGSRFTLRLPMR